MGPQHDIVCMYTLIPPYRAQIALRQAVFKIANFNIKSYIFPCKVNGRFLGKFQKTTCPTVLHESIPNLLIFNKKS